MTQVHQQPTARRRAGHLPEVGLDGPPLPPGRVVSLGDRGAPFVRELAGPGTPDAPTLVLLHGWTATSDLNWFTTIAALGEHARVLAFDHRGHGRGIRSTEPFRLADCADDVVALADELGVERVVPVGYSMGGPVAQLVARRHPDRVQGVVLCATSRNFAGSPRGKLFHRGMGAMAQALRLVPERLRLQLSERLVAHRSDDSPIREWADAQLCQSDVRMLAEAGAALGRFSSHEWIGELAVPAAVVVTMQDQVVPPHRQHKLAAALPDATVHEVADGQHSACVLQPDTFRAALVEAVQSVHRRTTTHPTGA
jgi:3-oxoadipate enol-lactonase